MEKGRLIKLFMLLFTAVFILNSCSTAQNKALIYVANEGDGTISVIDSQSLEVIYTMELEGMPHNVNVDPLGRYVYATNHEGEEEGEDEEDEHTEHNGHIPYLRILDAKTNKLLKSVKMEEMAAHVVPSKDGNKVYVSIEGGNSVVEIDVSQGTILRSFNVGEGPHGFVLSNDGSTLYTPNMRSNDVSILNLNSGNEERLKIEFAGNKCETPVAMGITYDDKFSFVTCGKSFEVYKIDNINKEVIGRVEFTKGEFPGPIQTPVYPNSNYLYVPDMRNGVVHKIDIEKFELIKDITSGDGSHGIAYSSDGKIAYVTNTWENTLSVIDLQSESIIKKVNVGSKPNGVAVTNGRNQGW